MKKKNAYRLRLGYRYRYGVRVCECVVYKLVIDPGLVVSGGGGGWVFSRIFSRHENRFSSGRRKITI